MKSLKLARRWTIALFAALLLSGTVIALASPSTLANLTGASGTGYDPLNPTELGRALQVGGASNMMMPQAGLARDGAGESVPAAPAEVLLLVERHQEEKAAYAQANSPRRADVYIYRYSDDTLVHQIVDVATGAVDQTETQQGVQLPLTVAEEQRSLAIAFADPVVRASLQQEYEMEFGQPLASTDQLQVKAMTFHADSAPGRDIGAAATCGLRRCAQLLLTAGENVVLQTIPVVNLSEGNVAHVLTFGATVP
ncbi:MAG: hypothetical protein IPK16_32755 [Anaerolineales bacterium]|nr:hypothetical protein [Anaerolineales bacterium]